MKRYRIVIDGSVYEREAVSEEDAAVEAVEARWRDDPPGDEDAVTAHVVEEGGREVVSFAIVARYSLSGIAHEADDDPTDADLALLGVDHA